MKKLLAILLAVTLVVSLAACSSKTSDDSAKAPEANNAAVTPVEVLNSVYAKFTEDQQFPVMGGFGEAPVMDGAGEIPVTDTENLVAMLHVAEDQIALVDSVASMMHAMNGNTFTSAAYKLKDASTAEDFVAALKESVMSTQWMCGFPDSLIIYTVNGDTVVAAFGMNDILDPFKANMTAVYGDSAVLSVEEAIV